MAIQRNDPIPRDAQYAYIIADIIRAQRELSRDPDIASYHLDGALRALIEAAAGAFPSAAHPLRILDQRRPSLARRFRLALRAPHAQARLAHLWALIDLLNADAASDAAPREV